MAVVLGLFALVAWICRPRARARDPRVVAIEKHFVELTSSASPTDAEATAAWLRARGVVALANAEAERQGLRERLYSGPSYRAFVVVLASELERARELLHGPTVPAGAAAAEEHSNQAAGGSSEDADPDAECGADDESSDWDESPRPPRVMERVAVVFDVVFRWGLRLWLAVVAACIVWSILC